MKYEDIKECKCPECKVVLHASDCAVHNEPAYPKGECSCGATKTKPLTEEEILDLCLSGGVQQWLQQKIGSLSAPLSEHTVLERRDERN